MKDARLPENVSANIGRAVQHEIEGDSTSEMRYLLFAVKDITTILTEYRDSVISERVDRIDHPTAKRYTVQLQRVSKRIAELIEERM